MKIIRELAEVWRVQWDKKRQQKEKYRIEYAFTSCGTKYYRFADITNLPYERGLMALHVYKEVEMCCSRQFLLHYTDVINKILHERQIDIFKINQLNEILKQRLTMTTDTELLYKLAAVCFFDKTENPAVYEPDYAEKKIAKWRKDKGVNDFFFAEAFVGVNALLAECRYRFRHLFSDVRRTQQDTLGVSPHSVLGQKIDEYEQWKDIVAEGNLANLNDMTFLEFMAKLDRIIDKSDKEAKAAQEHLNNIKHGSRK